MYEIKNEFSLWYNIVRPIYTTILPALPALYNIITIIIILFYARNVTTTI